MQKMPLQRRPREHKSAPQFPGMILFPQSEDEFDEEADGDLLDYEISLSLTPKEAKPLR
jgi:hypothetical protein